jgi:MFS family permease
VNPSDASPEGPPKTNPGPGGRPLLAIFLTVLADVFALTLVLPLLPFYARELGATDVQVGLVFATFAAFQLVSAPALGRLSDRIGRKPVLLASQAGTLVGLCVLGAATSLPMLFLGRAIDGATAGNLGIAQALIADVTKPEERTRAFGLIGIAFGLGFLVGPAASGWLAQHHGMGAPPAAAAVFSLASIVSTWLLVREPARTRSASAEPRLAAFSRILSNPGPRRRLGQLFAYALAFAQLTGGLGLYLSLRFGWGVEEVGYVFAFSGLCGALAQGGIKRAVLWLGEARLAASGFILMSCGYATLSVAATVPWLLFAAGTAALGAAVTRPAVTSLLTSEVGAEDHGAVLGVGQTLTSLAQLVGPVVAGAALGSRSPRLWALSAALSATLGLVVGTVRVGATRGPR